MGLLVLGDELESVLTAVSAVMLDVPVTLARRSTGLLGGLSTRGGLCYMDITPNCIPPLMRQFFNRIDFRRIALEPVRAAKALEEMLAETGVTVVSGIQPEVLHFDAKTNAYTLPGVENNQAFSHVIDTTPDADASRALGVPAIEGLGGLFGPNQNFLGISPVFQVSGVDWQAFRAFEEKLRQHPELFLWLEAALPYLDTSQRQELLKRPTFIAENPEELDYLDVLNQAIGVYYHVWRGRKPEDYPNAPIAIDGFNIALLPDGHNCTAMSLNGLVARLLQNDKTLQELLAYSHGKTCPDFLIEELKAFERFLKEIGGFKEATVHVPEELYVRQTYTLLAKQNMTASMALQGGVSKEKAIGTYSYWLDLRGAELWKAYPGEHLPKPVFNVGLDVALPVVPFLENFAFVSRSAGYSPIGQGTGRIVQHNSMLGEAVGIAAALSILTETPLSTVAESHIPQIKAILDSRNGSPIPIEGKATLDADSIRQSKLLQADEAAITQLRESATLSLCSL